MLDDGCLATVAVVGGMTTWTRGCCGTVGGVDSCQEVHTDMVGTLDTVRYVCTQAYIHDIL